jgi:hypothetical protein
MTIELATNTPIHKLEDTLLNSNDCLSFYTPDLNDLKHKTQQNLKQQQEKFNILKEILSSENKYLNDLKEIVDVRRIIRFFAFLFSKL